MALAQLTRDDLQLIAQAVARAEQTTGGEIVPVLTDGSDHYEPALWRAGAIAATLAGLALTLSYTVGEALLFLPPYLWLLTLLAAGSGAMALAADNWRFKRWFLSREHLQQRVLAKAKVAFHDHGVHHTEQRTGVLIYVSFFERQAVILADVGIAELVPNEAWETIVQQLVGGLRAGQTVASICGAIEQCSGLLADSNIQKPIDDDNQLDDQVRVYE